MSFFCSGEGDSCAGISLAGGAATAVLERVKSMHIEIEMIVEMSEHALLGKMNEDAKEMARYQLVSAACRIQALWTLALEDQLVSSARSDFPGEDYFSEKLTGLVSFARMALGIEDRLSYSDAEILKHIGHYADRLNSVLGKLSDGLST